MCIGENFTSCRHGSPEGLTIIASSRRQTLGNMFALSIAPCEQTSTSITWVCCSYSAPDQLQVMLRLPIIDAIFFGALDRTAHEKFCRIELALEKQNVSEPVQSVIIDGVN